MAETGDWITPKLYGQPWFEKPILYYWTAAVGFRLHFSAEWAARLPCAVGTLAAVIAIGWLGREMYGGDVRRFSTPALLAPLIFSTSVAGIGFSRAATPDMLFSASIALAMASAAGILWRRGALPSRQPGELLDSKSGRLPLILFGAFLGLGTLAKGPAAIVLAGGALLIWALATKRWRAAFRLAHPIAIGAFCLVALPWYAICAVRNPDFLRVFLFQHNFERYLTPVFQHRQPFWFFLPIALLGILPWTILLWPAVRAGLEIWRKKSWSDSPGFFFACWAIFPLIFFSFSESKLPGYILPAMPALAILCAVALAREFRKNGRSAFKIAIAIGITAIAILIAALVASRRINWSFALSGSDAHPMLPPAALAIAATAAFIAALIVASARKSLEDFALYSALYIAFCVAIINFAVLPRLDSFYSARPHAAFLQNDQHPDRIFAYKLRRDWNWGLAFYFHRQLPEWSPDDAKPALVLTTPQGLSEIRRDGRFHGQLDEPYAGVLYVPVEAARIR